MVTLLTILGPAGRPGRSAGPALSLPVRLRVTATGDAAARGLGLHGCVEAGARAQAGARTRAVLRGAVRSAARGRRIARSRCLKLQLQVSEGRAGGSLSPARREPEGPAVRFLTPA